VSEDIRFFLKCFFTVLTVGCVVLLISVLMVLSALISIILSLL